MKKKTVSILLTVVMVLSLAACGSSGTEESSESKSSSDASAFTGASSESGTETADSFSAAEGEVFDETTVTVFAAKSLNSVMEALISEYNKTQPKVKLVGSYDSSGTLMTQIEAQLQPWNVSTPAQEAGTAALRETAYVEKARTLIFQEQQFLREGLMKMGYPVLDSQANYLFFEGEADLYEKLLQEGVMIRDCSNYPGLWKGCYRIAVKLHTENEQLLEKIRKVRR